MTFSVYIISSLKDVDTVYELERVLNQYGIQVLTGPIVKPGAGLEESIKTTIMNSDCTLVMIGKEGRPSNNVNYEIGLAMGLGKLVIPIVEKGSEIPRNLADKQYIIIDKEYPKLSYEGAAQYLNKLKIEKESRSTIGGLILLGIGLLILGAIASGD